MEVHILSVREQSRCDQIIELSFGDDGTYLKSIAETMEGIALTWITESVLSSSYYAYSPLYPNKCYTVRLWTAVDQTP